MRIRILVSIAYRLVVAASAAGLSQAQHLWTEQISNLRARYHSVQVVPDRNGDGWSDLLVGYRQELQLGQGPSFASARILSGRDGTTLATLPAAMALIAVAGDRDGDGADDYFRCSYNVYIDPFTPPDGFRADYMTAGGVVVRIVNLLGPTLIKKAIADSDLDGDGQPDLIAQWAERIEAYDTLDAPLWSALASTFGNGASFYSMDRMRDVDGDGSPDLLVLTSNSSFTLSNLWILSGRTGAVLRQHPGATGSPGVGGDVDGDGADDYALTQGTQLTVFSGATGAVLQTISGPSFGSPALVDADQDGFADFLVGGAPTGGMSGNPSRVVSSRDQAEIMTLVPPTAFGWFGQRSATALPAAGGSPYPVVVRTVAPFGEGYDTIAVTRLMPTGVTVTGTGCSSAGTLPSIGVRTLGAAGMRVLTGSAPPSALAWCAFDFAGGIPAPIPLDSLGLSGCVQLVGLRTVWAGIVGSIGMDHGYVGVDLPNTLVAVGTPYEAQWLLLDPTTGTFATTARHEFRVR